MRLSPLLFAGLLASTPALAQSAGGVQARPDQAPQARSISPDGGVKPFQPLGDFPTNTVTDRPFVGPQGGDAGYKKTVAALQRTLTELQQLQLELKESHWNLSGSMFYPLHLLFQEHYEGVSKYADQVAQRLLAIGSSADGRATTIVRTSAIPEMPGGFLDDAQLIVWWTNTYKLVGDELRRSIHDVNDVDPTSGNLLQSVEQGIDEYQWFFRAMVQSTPTDRNTGWNLNAGKPVDLPARVPAGQPPANGAWSGGSTNPSGN